MKDDKPLLPLFPYKLSDPEGTFAKEYNALQEELKLESDRASAVLGVSMLEWRIRQIIEFRLCFTGTGDNATPAIDAAKQKQLAMLIGDDDEDIQPRLGFKDQCRLAFSLGLIGPMMLRDLSRLAVIRNRFAHRFQLNSFIADEDVSDSCQALESTWAIEKSFQQSPVEENEAVTNDLLRERFVGAVNAIFIGTHFVTYDYGESLQRQIKSGLLEPSELRSRYFW